MASSLPPPPTSRKAPVQPPARQIASPSIPSTPVELTSAQELIKTLSQYSDTGVGVYALTTSEPDRALQAIQAWSFSKELSYRQYDMTAGWMKYPDASNPKAPIIQEAKPKGIVDDLKWVHDMTADGTFGDNYRDGVLVMQWPHFWATHGPGRQAMPPIISILNRYSNEFLKIPAANPKRNTPPQPTRLILLMPEGVTIPQELEHKIVMLRMKLPTQAELEASYHALVTRPRKVKNPTTGVDERQEVKLNFSHDQMKRVLGLGAGMTMIEFDNAVSLAIMENRKDFPNIPEEPFCKVISQAKVDVIRKSNVLELVDTDVTMSDVGGMDLLKQWMHDHRACFTEEGKQFGLDPVKGITVLGPPGCLSGETNMLYLRGDRNSGRLITLENLYKKFNGIPTDSRPWERKLPTYLHSFDAETGKVTYNRIVSVIQSGVKKVFRLNTQGGRSLKLTSDHPVLTEDAGFVAAGNLTTGTSIIVRGTMKPREHAVKHGRRLRVTVEGLKYYASGWDKKVISNDIEYNYKRQRRACLVFEANMNGLSYTDYLERLKTDPDAINLKTIPEGMIIHHVNEDPMDDSLSNLCLMFKPDHDRLHNDEDKFNCEYTALDTVTSVEFVGEEETYDIQMELPCNNFTTADGLIVHNTGKSLLSKAVASALGMPLIKFDIGRVFGSLLGESEKNVRNALALLETVAPAVVWLDEIDKSGMNANQASGDGGVGKRIFGTILQFMQETKKPIFWMATGNWPKLIDPAFLRKGRIDEVFAVLLPTMAERRQVFEIHLKKRGCAVPVDLDNAIEASEGFVNSELEQAVKSAKLQSFHRKTPVTGALLVEMLRESKKLKDAYSDEFDEMENWARQNARPASTPERGYEAPRHHSAETFVTGRTMADEQEN